MQQLQQQEKAVISLSLVRRTPASKSLNPCLNLGKHLTELLDLKNVKYAVPYCDSTRKKYRVVFTSTPTDLELMRAVAVQITTGGGARILFKPGAFDMGPQPVAAVQFVASLVGNQLHFEYDKEEFLKPKVQVKETRKIESVEEKTLAGFKPDTAWGQKFTVEIEEEVEQEILRYMHCKYGGKNGNGCN